MESLEKYSIEGNENTYDEAIIPLIPRETFEPSLQQPGQQRHNY
jgi:hypothetical protein